MRDVVIGTLNRPKPVALVHGRILAEMIHRAVRCLGLVMVEEKMAQGVVDADGGKKQVAYHFSFSVIEE